MGHPSDRHIGFMYTWLKYIFSSVSADQLPSGFSETLLKEEEKLRPKFDRSLQVESTQLTMKSSQKSGPGPSDNERKQVKIYVFREKA